MAAAGDRRGGPAASQTTKDTVSHGNESPSLKIEAMPVSFPTLTSFI